MHCLCCIVQYRCHKAYKKKEKNTIAMICKADQPRGRMCHQYGDLHLSSLSLCRKCTSPATVVISLIQSTMRHMVCCAYAVPPFLRHKHVCDCDILLVYLQEPTNVCHLGHIVDLPKLFMTNCAQRNSKQTTG